MIEQRPNGRDDERRNVEDVGRFEEWLSKQADRDDNTGAVARFIVEDIQRGCWPSSYRAPDFVDRWDDAGRVRDKFERHLVNLHFAESGSIKNFEKVYREYLDARRAYLVQSLRGPETRPVEF